MHPFLSSITIGSFPKTPTQNGTSAFQEKHSGFRLVSRPLIFSVKNHFSTPLIPNATDWHRMYSFQF